MQKTHKKKQKKKKGTCIYNIKCAVCERKLLAHKYLELYVDSSEGNLGKKK